MQEQQAPYGFSSEQRPEFPIGAPASASDYGYHFQPTDLDTASFGHATQSVASHHQHSLSHASLPAYSTQYAESIQSRPSAGHSRSASVASTSFSHASQPYHSKSSFGLSTPSSATSSFGESGSSGSASFLSMSTSRAATQKLRGQRLTDADRKILCDYHTQNPRMKHEHIGQVFGIERSTVSKILKNKQKWVEITDTAPPRFENRFDQHAVMSNRSALSATESARRSTPPSLSHASQAQTDVAIEAPSTGRHPKRGRHPELELALTTWGKQQTAGNIMVTDEQLKQKALDIAAAMGIELGQFKASPGWLENYKARSGLNAGRFPATQSDLQPPSGQAPPVADTIRTLPHLQRPNLQIMQPDIRTPDPSESGMAYYGPDWAAPQTSMPTHESFGVWTSPLNVQRRRAPTAMSASSGSLPGLAEESSTEDSMMQSSSSYSGGLQSSGLSAPYPSFLRSDTTSYSSADSSPYPSPVDGSVTSISYASHSPINPTQQHWSTPMQQSSHTIPASNSSASTSHSPVDRMQQAQQVGMAFQLSLDSDSNASEPYQGQGIEVPLYHAHPDARAAFQATAEMAEGSGQATATGKSSYSLRSRVQSAAQSQSLRIPSRSRQISQPSPLSLHGDAYRSTSSAREAQSQNPTDHRHLESYMPAHQPAKAPLVRSNTDPMPLLHTHKPSFRAQEHQMMDQHIQDQYTIPAPYEQDLHNQKQQDQDRPSSDETAREKSGGEHERSSGIQVDSLMEQVLEPKGQQPTRPPASQGGAASRLSPVHPRRATVSTGTPSDPSMHRMSDTFGAVQAVTPTYSHFGLLPRGVDLNEPVALEDAYMALRKVVGYLHHSQSGIRTPSSAGSATVSTMAATSFGSAGGPKVSSGEMQVLEGLLSQFWDAHVARLHSLTPPSSG